MINTNISLNDIPNLPASFEADGKYRIELNLAGLSRRVALATLYDEVHRIVDGNTGSVNVSTDSQKKWLSKFGINAPESERVAQALIDDVCEQLDRDVIRDEQLDEGTMVVHVKDKLTFSSIKCLNPPYMVKLRGPGAPCFARMLRRYREDGDYRNTKIPEEYFTNKWLLR